MATPSSHFKANVTFNPFGGNNNNSIKPPENELKIMFWNIQNLFEHGIMSADEYLIEQGIGYNKIKKKSTDSTKATMKIKKKNVDNQMGITVTGTPTATNKNDKFGVKAMRRHWIARAIHDSGADIVVIAELMIGIVDLRAHINEKIVAKRNEDALKEKKGAFFAVDTGGGSWGPKQIQIDLNKLFETSGNPWQSAVSVVNAVNDFTCKLQGTKLVLEKGKNSMLEMYGLLWRSDRVSLGDKSVFDAINIVTQDNTGNTLKFNERAPGHIEIYSPLNKSKKYFDLFCIHNLFGDEKGAGAAERIRANRAEGIKNMAKLGVFDPKKPTVVVGDFNLDAGNKQEAPLYKPFSDTMTRRIKDTKTSYTEKGLVSEYDHIYTSELGAVHPDDGSIDIAVKYFNGSYEAARVISDHMPVVAVLKSSEFDVAKPSLPFDTVAVDAFTQMKRVKSEDPKNPGKAETDSLFIASARSYINQTNDTVFNENQTANEIRMHTSKLLMRASENSTVAKLVYRRIDDLYETAKYVNPIEIPKSLDEWEFDTDDEKAIAEARKVIRAMIEGYKLDESLEYYGYNWTQREFDYISRLVVDAFSYEDNWNYKVNPQAQIPGIGKSLHQAFLKEPPLYEECYEAYCFDIAFSGVMSGSEAEIYAIAEFYRVPVIVYGVDDKGQNRQWTYNPDSNPYTQKLKNPIYLLKVDDRFDFLFK